MIIEKLCFAGEEYTCPHCSISVFILTDCLMPYDTGHKTVICKACELAIVLSN